MHWRGWGQNSKQKKAKKKKTSPEKIIAKGRHRKQENPASICNHFYLNCAGGTSQCNKKTSKRYKN